MQLKRFFYILIFLFFPIFCFAADYHVTQSGAGAQNGTSEADAWSVSDFNALTGTGYAGDTIYFHDDFTSEIEVNIDGTSGNYVTLDGLESGDYDPWGESDDGQAIITRTQSSGQYGIKLYNGRNYLIIQDFEIKEFNQGITAQPYSATDTNIIIRRNFIHDGLGAGIYFYTDNYITIGGASGNGNVVKDVCIDTGCYDVGLANSHDIIISYNHLYATKSNGDSGDRGIDGIVFNKGSNTGLIEYNTIHGHKNNYGADAKGEDGIDLKDDTTPASYAAATGTYDTIVRFNDIFDNMAHGIHCNRKCHDVFIYGNRVWDNGNTAVKGGNGIDVYRGGWNIWIFSNLVYENGSYGIAGYSKTGSGYGLLYNIYVYNNTIAENSKHITGTYAGNLLFSFQDGEHKLKNNIFYKSDETNYTEWDIRLDSDLEIDYNQYYWPSQTANLRLALTNYSISTLPGTYDDNGAEGDPGLTDIDNNDYTISGGGSAVVDAGYDLSECFNITIQNVLYNLCIDDALDPINTDWSISGAGTGPPVVATIKQDSQGSWEMGAYVWYAGTAPPELSSAVIASNGTTLTLAFDTDVYDGSAYSDAHWDVDCDVTGDDVAVTYVEGKDSSTWVFTLASTIQSSETCNIDFDGTANSMENSVGDDMAAIVSDSVTNNSVQDAEAVTQTFDNVGSGDQSISVPGSQTITVNP